MTADCGTLRVLGIDPAHDLMAGKALPSMLVGIVQASGVPLVAQRGFRLPVQGSFLTLYAGLVLFVLAAVGIGLVDSALTYTMPQAMLFSFVLIMPFARLPGLTTPLRNMPPSLQYFTAIDPLRYAIEITQWVYLEGAGINILLPDLWPLTAISLLTLAAAAWMFRHRLQ